MTIPDFTRGDTIPAGAKHDWNLGPTGLRGWIFCDKMVTSDARQIALTPRELHVLLRLMKNAGRVLTKAQITETLAERNEDIGEV